MKKARAVLQPEYLVAQACGPLAFELDEYLADQLLVLRSRLGLDLVAHDHRFHDFAPRTLAFDAAARCPRPFNRKPTAAPASESAAQTPNTVAKPALNCCALL